MRQFLLGLVIAALVFWAWSGSQNAPADGGAAGSGTGMPGSGASGTAGPLDPTVGSPADLESMMPGVGGAEAAGPTRDPEPRPLNATSRSGEAVAMDAALARLLEGLQAGDAAAREQALRLLEREDLWSEHRQRLRQALGLDVKLPEDRQPEDVETALARVGENNAFLHSTEGRHLGGRVLELARDLPDDKAVAVLTGLLERCMRGHIGKDDAAARAFVDQAYAQHRVRADRFLCDPANLSKARSHTVVKGDSLGKIAKRFRAEGIFVDEGSLAVLNRIHNPNAIQVGQRIRVPVEPIRAVVEKRSFLMAVYLGDQILRLYWVGHGVDGKTPVAEFKVAEKLKDPDWYAPDGGVYPAGSPENILGRYFLKFTHPSYTGFGAHGTPMPETIGTESSMGCIRMYDKDIEELYRLLPRDAKVEIRDSH